MSASVINGKITGLPGLGDGLKFMYLVLAEGDELFGEPLTTEALQFLIDDMNSMIGQDIEHVTIDEESHSLFTDLTDSSVIDKTGEFALIVLAVDTEPPAHNDRRVFAVYADMVSGTIVSPGEIENTTPTDNAGGAVLSNSLEELKSAVLSAEEIEAMENGANIEIKLIVDGDQTRISQEDKKLVESELGNHTVGMYLDVSLLKIIDDVETPLSNLNNQVTISITLPDSLINTDPNLFRTYKIIRVHHNEDSGKTEVSYLTPTYNTSTKTLSFKTDCFSTYAIVYTDTTVPQTGDSSTPLLWSAALLVSLTGLAVVLKKRKDFQA